MRQAHPEGLRSESTNFCKEPFHIQLRIFLQPPSRKEGDTVRNGGARALRSQQGTQDFARDCYLTHS